MSENDLTQEQVIANVMEMLDMAKSGLADVLSPDSTRTRPGAMNMLSWGRSVTLTVQTMKSFDREEFPEWWKPYQDYMAANPLMKYCNGARVDVVHKGSLPSTNVTSIGEHGPVIWENFDEDLWKMRHLELRRCSLAISLVATDGWWKG